MLTASYRRRFLLRSLCLSTLAACAANRAHPAASVADVPSVSPTPSPVPQAGQPVQAEHTDYTGRYELAFVMQGSPVDMVLTITRAPGGQLTGATRAMGTVVPIQQVVTTVHGIHITLDPSVSGEASIDLAVRSDSASGTLVWQGQPTKISGRRVR